MRYLLGMRPCLLLCLLALYACAPKPVGAGSDPDSGVSMADIYKAANVQQKPSECSDALDCLFFTQVPPEVLRSQLNLAPYSPHGEDLLTVAGRFKVTVTPSSLDYFAVEVKSQ